MFSFTTGRPILLCFTSFPNTAQKKGEIDDMQQSFSMDFEVFGICISSVWYNYLLNVSYKKEEIGDIKL